MRKDGVAGKFATDEAGQAEAAVIVDLKRRISSGTANDIDHGIS